MASIRRLGAAGDQSCSMVVWYRFAGGVREYSIILKTVTIVGNESIRAALLSALLVLFYRSRARDEVGLSSSARSICCGQ